MAEAHLRIDEGIKRGPRPARKERIRKPDGSFLPADPELKNRIIQDAITALQRGETTDDVGMRHGVSGRAVRAWLIGTPEAEIARGYLISSQLARTIDEIKDADAPMPLARAREEFRAWSWIAERRESRLYGQKQEVKVDIDMTVTVEHSLAEEAKTLIAKIRGSKPSPVIDLTPEEPDLT